MSFANPAGLLWALPAVALILALYMLRLRRRDVTVPSTYLWRRVVRDVKANTPFQRLRRSLLLYAQIAVALALVAAVARPYVRSRARTARSVVIVVDTSASMGAREGTGTRLDAARSAARKVIDSMGAGDRAMLVEAGARTAPLTGFTADRAELRSALADLRVRETGVDMRQALALAGAMLAAERGARVHVLTDGGFESVAGVDLGGAAVRFHRLGEARDNVGITAADSRHVTGGQSVVQVFVSVRNFGPSPRRVTLALTHGRNTLDAREMDLAAGGEAAEVMQVPPPARPIVVEASLDADDALAADNRAYLVLAPHRPVDVLLVTRGNPHLEAAIGVEPDVRLRVAAPGAARDLTAYDVVVFDGEAPPVAPPVSAFYIDCAPRGGPVTPGHVVTGAGVLPAANTHPVLRYVDLARVRWPEVRTATPAPWAQEIASAGDGAALVAGERGSVRSVWTGFRLDAAHGSFPLTVSYPVLVTNAVRWLARADAAAGTPSRTGTPLVLQGPEGARTLVVVTPDGTRRRVPAGPEGSAAFDDADRVGVYRVSAPGVPDRLVAANLVDETESAVAPRAVPDVPGAAASPQGPKMREPRHAWPWLAVGALALMCAEWWLFHRRVHLA